MEAATFLSGLSIVATTIVGYILSRQIKSQKEIIEQYKGLVEATSPSKIIELHEREVGKLKQVMGNDIEGLREQVYELANYVDAEFYRFEQLAKNIEKPEMFNRRTIEGIVLERMPHCVKVLNDVYEAKKNIATNSIE